MEIYLTQERIIGYRRSVKSLQIETTEMVLYHNSNGTVPSFYLEEKAMDGKKFRALLNYILSSEFSIEQAAALRVAVQNVKITHYEKSSQGYHISEYASKNLDKMIEAGAGLSECMKVCNVSKTTVLRHREKLKKQKEQELLHQQEVLSRDDSDIEKKVLECFLRGLDGELPF